MNVIRQRPIMFDVDDTLVLWEKKCGSATDDNFVEIVDPYDNRTMYLEKHKPHVKLLSNHIARDSAVFVWSQNGVDWAVAVLQALGYKIGETPNLYVITKPSEYVDDLPVSDWMNNRIYLNPSSPWGHL